MALLAMGVHEITRDYVKGQWLNTDLRSLVALPPTFRPGHVSRLFPSTTAAGAVVRYANDDQPEWLYFLDDEQLALTDSLVASCETALISHGSLSANFVLGGPGTGKTSILLQLLMRLTDSVVPNAETWAVALHVSDELAQFITVSTGWDLTECRRLAEDMEAADVILIDDPTDSDLIRRASELARTGRPRAVVVGFDPLQLGDSIDDAGYDDMRKAFNAFEHRLTSCYRQKAAVGEVAVRVADAVASSSPFLLAEKKLLYAQQRERLTSLANRVTFRNPSGRAVTYNIATTKDWQQHLAWIARQPGLWKHWPPVLVVEDREAPLSALVLQSLGDLNYARVDLSDVRKIKGLEYQHVLLSLSSDRFDALENGFAGTGRRLYDEYRLIRIPFSRAKDSVALFVA